MALFPTVPFGQTQASTPGPLFGSSSFKYPLKRGVRRRVGEHSFCDFSKLKYKKGGAPLLDFEIQSVNMTTGQKEVVRLFYVRAQGESDTWAMNFDSQSYAGCRFVSGFVARLQSNKIWTVTLQARALISSTQPIPPYKSGAGAPIIVPSVAATATVNWNVLWNATAPLTFANGQTTASFDASQNATLSYIPGSGGEGSNGSSTGDFYEQYGYDGAALVEPNGGLGIGPVVLGIGPFQPGDELILQVVTTGSATGTTPGTIFYSGPAWRNADGTAHASVTWSIP